MAHFGLFVESIAYPMATQVAHHTVVVFLGVLLDGLADVVDKAPRLGSLHTDFQALLGDTYQLFLLGRCLTYYIHTRGVSIIAVENRGKVDIDDVALLQDVVGLGYAVTHHLVDARTYTHGERRSLLVATIVQTGGNGVVQGTVVATNLVNLQRRHTRTNFLLHSVQHARIDDTRTADALYLLRGLNQFWRWHQRPFVFQIHDALVQFRRLLPSLAAPSSFYHSSRICLQRYE